MRQDTANHTATTMSIRAIDRSLMHEITGTRLRGSSSSELSSSSSPSQSDAVITSDNLRSASQIFARAVTTISSVASVLNISEAALEDAKSVVESAISIAKEAADSATPKSKRRKLNREYQKLGRDFQDILDGVETDDIDPLSLDSITSLFAMAGLEGDNSRDIKDFLNNFITPPEDDSLASDEMEASGIKLPSALLAMKSSGSVETFDFDISDRNVAIIAYANLNALKDQIDNNLETVNMGRELLQANLEAVQIVGSALLNLADTLTSPESAEQAAKDLVEQIRRYKPSSEAIDQLDNIKYIYEAMTSLSFPSSSSTSSQSQTSQSSSNSSGSSSGGTSG